MFAAILTSALASALPFVKYKLLEPSVRSSVVAAAILASALAFVKYRLVEPSLTSSLSPLSSLSASLVAICVAMYALTDCCDGALELLSLAKLSSSIILFAILASALASV